MNILYYNYYYRYKEGRKQCNILVNSANYQDAKTKLDTFIAEHTAKYGTTKAMKLDRPDFNYGERLAMNHAKTHLDYVITDNDPSFTIDLMDGSPITVSHHSDIVKQALNHTPKADYSEV